jgi:LysM repeat protein
MGLPGLGGVPRVAIWGLLLVLVALLVFLFGPNLLGFGGAGDATPTPAASVEPTPTPVPTPTPEPTPQVYVVAKGDTMSKIARKYGVTIDEILAVNPQIKNPNKIQIGDEIVIPTPVEDGNGFVDDGTVAGESSAP